MNRFFTWNTLSIILMKVSLELKDRDVIRYNPHALVEGMAIATYVMVLRQVITIRGEF